MYLYLPIAQRGEEEALGSYLTFGLEIYETAGEQVRRLKTVSDVSVDAATACAIARDCTLEQLEPCHLYDVLEDHL